jgi:hypothetical protein
LIEKFCAIFESKFNFPAPALAWLLSLPGYCTLRRLCAGRPGPGNSRGHIFLIFRYCRMSGNDMTARSPRPAAAAAMVIAVMYPSVRIACLLFFS